MATHCLVLFSGGQDSTTCLAWALDHYETVETLGFDYGQRHSIELAQRPIIREKIVCLKSAWKNRLGEDHLLDLSLLHTLSDTALTQERAIQLAQNGLPNTFVPGRNILFLTIAATLAYRRGINVIVGGMCETDYSGYPDCRDDAIKALQVALNVGMETSICLATPLMWLNKCQTFKLADHLGGQPLLDIIRLDTHTCYLGERTTLHEWGYGCGSCPACLLRAKGHAEFIHPHSR